jgi:hypothetical protein
MSRGHFENIACILSYTEVKDEKSITSILKSCNSGFKPELFWRRVREYQNGIVK